MKRCRALIAVAVVFAVMFVVMGCGSGDEEVATEASTKWLELIDASEYREGWVNTARVFQNGVTPEEFEKTVRDSRELLGKFVSRKVRSAQSARSLPNAPRGRYVVVQYDSVFQNQRNAVESVTELYEDGEWKVSGYRSR